MGRWDGPTIDRPCFPDVGVRGNDDEYDIRPADRRSLALGWVRARRERSQRVYDRSHPYVAEPFVSFAPARRRNLSCVRLRDPERVTNSKLLDDDEEEEDGDVLRGDFRCAGGGVRGNGAQEEADG